MGGEGGATAPAMSQASFATTSVYKLHAPSARAKSPSETVRALPRLRATRVAVAVAMVVVLGVLVGVLCAVFIPGASQLVPPAVYCSGAGCVDFNHSLWTRTLQRFVVPGAEQDGVTYNAIDYPALMQDPADLEAYLALLAAANFSALSEDGFKALMVNAYNAFAVDMSVSHPCSSSSSSSSSSSTSSDPPLPCASIKDVAVPLGVGSVWTWRTFTLGGVPCSLDDIEQGIVRPVFQDPRMHAALNCASVSCPDLAPEAFLAETLSAQLDARVRAWLGNPSKGLQVAYSGGEAGGVVDGLRLSMIFSWYASDFATEFPGGLAGYLTAFGPPDAVASFVDAFGTDSDAWAAAVSYFPYDWALATTTTATAVAEALP